MTLNMNSNMCFDVTTNVCLNMTKNVGINVTMDVGFNITAALRLIGSLFIYKEPRNAQREPKGGQGGLGRVLASALETQATRKCVKIKHKPYDCFFSLNIRFEKPYGKNDCETNSQNYMGFAEISFFFAIFVSRSIISDMFEPGI